MDVALRNVWPLALKLTILGREFGEVKEASLARRPLKLQSFSVPTSPYFNFPRTQTRNWSKVCLCVTTKDQREREKQVKLHGGVVGVIPPHTVGPTVIELILQVMI